MVISDHEDRAILVEGCEHTRYVIVYVPGASYFCVEPVSHVSNAIHMADPLGHGLRSLGPGERTSAWMQLDIAVV